MAKWPYCQNMDIWSIWVSLERTIQMQHSDKGIKSIGPSCKKWEQQLSDRNYPLYFLKIPLYTRKLLPTPQKW